MGLVSLAESYRKRIACLPAGNLPRTIPCSFETAAVGIPTATKIVPTNLAVEPHNPHFQVVIHLSVFPADQPAALSSH
jgi:hypothetical protein